MVTRPCFCGIIFFTKFESEKQTKRRPHGKKTAKDPDKKCRNRHRHGEIHLQKPMSSCRLRFDKIQGIGGKTNETFDD